MTDRQTELREQIKALKEELESVRKVSSKAGDVNTTKMSKAEIIQRALDMLSMPDSLMEVLERDGFRTGSTVYTNISDATDVDWCISIPPTVFEGYAIGMSNPGYWDNDKFQAIYAHHNGCLLNIMCFSDYGLWRAWQQATDIMRDLYNNAPPKAELPIGCISIAEMLRTKWKRVRVFRALVDTLWPEGMIENKMQVHTTDEAIEYRVCKDCGREAINFTCKPERDKYEQTGVCERCLSVR